MNIFLVYRYFGESFKALLLIILLHINLILINIRFMCNNMINNKASVTL